MAVQVYSKAMTEKIAAHMERRAEWRTVRLAGTRYVVMPSGHSDKVYWLDMVNDRCSCPWYQRTLTACSHLRAAWQSERSVLQPAPASTNDSPLRGPRVLRQRFANVVGFCEAKFCDGDRLPDELFCERHVLVDCF